MSGRGREEKEMVVFSSVGGMLENTLVPFHHFITTTTTTTTADGFKSIRLILPRTYSRSHHLSSVRLLHPLFITTKKNKNGSFIFCCSNDSTDNFSISSTSSTTLTPPQTPTPTTTTSTAPLLRKRTRYRKLYPGENQGIVEEMRFIAMKLRNNNNNTTTTTNNNYADGDEPQDSSNEKEGDGETWQPSIEGFLKYLVNSKLVFQTLERVVDESDHVSYTYFRKTGLERSKSLEKDIEWFRQQNVLIPEPSIPGVSYAEYLVELAEKSAPMFLCHFYNIYFAHISGGQVIAKQVSEKLLEGKELEFCRWEGDEKELLKDARENLNKLGEHWSRDEKNKCLREAVKSFKYLGQIVRLIIL